jgi:hypothetical protein
LEIHFHGDVAAAIEVGMYLTLKPDGKCAAGLTRINHIERHSHAAFVQFSAVAQGQ